MPVGSPPATLLEMDTCDTCGSPRCISRNGWRCPEALIEVSVDVFDAFEKAFRRLVRRADKLGAELPTFEVRTEYTVLHWARDAFGTRWVSGGTHVRAIHVSGPRPKFAGWSLLATLEPLETKDEAGGVVYVNLIKSVPGAGELPESLRAGRQCDHCRKIRARSETFVVRHEDGRIVRVGRQCIADFLGGASPENVALQFAFATDLAAFGGSEDEEGGCWGPRRPTSWPLRHYVALVVREIRANGWLSRSATRETEGCATADAALVRVTGCTLSRLLPETPDAEELAQATRAIAWAAAFPARSDFEHNIQAIARSEEVTQKTIGLAAAIFGAYERSEAREVERRKKLAELPPSHHVGVVKARLELVLTVTRIVDLESQWGATHLHVLVDDAGNVFKWFASSERLDVGARYHVRGTVKGHGDYKGRAETTLSRCVATPIAYHEAQQAENKRAKAEKRKPRTLTLVEVEAVQEIAS